MQMDDLIGNFSLLVPYFCTHGKVLSALNSPNKEKASCLTALHPPRLIGWLIIYVQKYNMTPYLFWLKALFDSDHNKFLAKSQGEAHSLKYRILFIKVFLFKASSHLWICVTFIHCPPFTFSIDLKDLHYYGKALHS